MSELQDERVIANISIVDEELFSAEGRLELAP